ncbi:MAG: hypothetical protein GC161_17455 [Planctomycetaceae bacterium]|nr:hypothetical protein [Planctomycetaceae bacterium]
MALAGACAVALVVFTLSDRVGDPSRSPALREFPAFAAEGDGRTHLLLELRPEQRTEVREQSGSGVDALVGGPSPIASAGAERGPIHLDGHTIPADGYTLHNGYLTVLHTDGSPAERGNWDGKYRQGDWEYFSEEGHLELQSFYVNGIAERQGTRWYPDGRVEGHASILNGKFHGPRMQWNRDGTLDAEVSGEYVHGVKVH